jgi:hypothetical protein
MTAMHTANSTHLDRLDFISSTPVDHEIVVSEDNSGGQQDQEDDPPADLMQLWPPEFHGSVSPETAQDVAQANGDDG